MIEPLAVEFTALAVQHIREAEQWWRLNRPAAPNAIREEVQRLLQSLQYNRVLVHVLQTSRSQAFGAFSFHASGTTLYFHVTGLPEFVEVVAFWHSSRGSGPPI